MANTTIKTRILLRNDTLANWESSQLTLGKGEVAIAKVNDTLAEFRVAGADGATWANALKLNITTNQVSGLTDLISSLVGDGAKKYQVVSTDTNSWKLQEAALSGGDWSDVADSTWTVDFSAINDAISGLTADVDYLSGQIDDLADLVDDTRTTLNTVSSDYLTSADYETLSNTITALDDAKLAKSEFSDLSNEIGLSAASSSNPVVTKNDIADLAGAMHFKGAVTSLAEIESAEPGDVVIIPSTSKEYVYNGVAEAAYSVDNWVELGDEVLYATKAEVSTVSAELTADIAGLTADVDYLSGQIDATNNTLNTVSSDYLTSADKTELETLVGNVSAETLVSANAYTDSKFAGLSDYYTKDEVDAISAALSTDYAGKIDALDTKVTENYALSADVDALVAAVSADTVETVVGASTDLSTADTVWGAKAYANAKEAEAEAYADDKVSELSNSFLILDGGTASLRQDEPTPPFSA